MGKTVSGAQICAQVKQAQGGSEQALAWLIARQMPQIRSLAARAVRPGMEFDDAVQEGIIGLFSALRTFDEARGVSFPTYAGVCVQNAVASAVRASQRLKNAPLNEACPYFEVDSAPSPEELLLQSERVSQTMHSIVTRLSPMEKRVLRLFLKGDSYADIARRLGVSEKAIDNAMQRVRLKLR